MKILILSATSFEVLALAGEKIQPYVPQSISIINEHNTDFLVTGVGAVPTTFFIAKFGLNYDLILNIGIAGSFSNKYSIGDVFFVSDDAFGDFGIDNNGEFIPFYKSGMVFESTNPLELGYMKNPWLKSVQIEENRLVRGVTLGTTSGSDKRIEEIKRIWNPDIETMESAAVFFSCLKLNVPFICIRAISNMVEPRNEKNWDIKKAVNNLCNFSLDFIPKIKNNIF